LQNRNARANANNQGFSNRGREQRRGNIQRNLQGPNNRQINAVRATNQWSRADQEALVRAAAPTYNINYTVPPPLVNAVSD
jgi:hypothetical protein